MSRGGEVLPLVMTKLPKGSGGPFARTTSCITDPQVSTSCFVMLTNNVRVKDVVWYSVQYITEKVRYVRQINVMR